MYLIDLKLKLGANYDQSDNADARYDTRNVSVSAGLEFPIAEQSRLDLRYKIFADEVRNVETTASTLLKAEDARGGEKVDAWGLGEELPC